jgi:hypothetical protein
MVYAIHVRTRRALAVPTPSMHGTHKDTHRHIANLALQRHLPLALTAEVR